MLRAMRRPRAEGWPKGASKGVAEISSAPPIKAAKVALVTRSRFVWGSRRVKVAALGAACSGARPGVFTPKARASRTCRPRIARNTPQTLLAESHLGDVLDPLGGAPAIESLTDALGRAAWAQLQAISDEGGLAAAWRDGKVHARVNEAQRLWTAQLRARKAPIVGVSDFVDPAEAPLTRQSLLVAAPGEAAMAGPAPVIRRGAEALAELAAAAQNGAGLCALGAALTRDEPTAAPPLLAQTCAAPAARRASVSGPTTPGSRASATQSTAPTAPSARSRAASWAGASSPPPSSSTALSPAARRRLSTQLERAFHSLIGPTAAKSTVGAGPLASTRARSASKGAASVWASKGGAVLCVLSLIHI